MSQTTAPAGPPDATDQVTAPAEPPGAAGAADRPHDGGTVRSALLWSYLLGGGHAVAYGLLTLLLAAILLPEAFGVMALAMLWVTFAQMLLHEGPSLAVIQRAGITDRHFDAAFWINLATALLIAVAFAAVAPLWAIAVDVPQLAVICWALTPVIILHALMVVPDAILRRRMQLRRLMTRVLLATIASGTVGVLAALAGFGVWALVAHHLTYSTLSVVLLWLSTSWRPRWGPIGAAVRDLRRFSLMSVSEFLAGFVATRADALLAGLFFGPVAIGLYRFSLRIVEMASDLAFDGVRQITVPHLSRLQDDRRQFAAQLGKLVHAGAVLALPALGIVAAVSHPLLSLLGPEWVEATAAMRMLCLAGAVTAVGQLLVPAVQAAGRPGVAAVIGWTGAAVAAASIVTVGIGFSAAPPATQVMAMAVALLAAQATIAALTLLVTIRRVLRMRIWPILAPTGPALAAGCLAAGVGIAAQQLGVERLPLLAGLLGTGAAASLVAGAFLFATDAEFVARVRQVLRRRPGQPVPE
jgi:PST family polysaccharide transporter